MTSLTLPEGPVGLQEIAAMFGMQRNTVDQWRTRGMLPTIDWEVGQRPAWDIKKIAEWAHATNREIRVHGPGSVASNATVWDRCRTCSKRLLFEVYIDPDTRTITHQATDDRGKIVCDVCAVAETNDEDVMRMPEGDLNVLALRFGGSELVDRIHAEAAEHADLYPYDDNNGPEPAERATAYLTVWRLRVGDAVNAARHTTAD